VNLTIPEIVSIVVGVASLYMLWGCSRFMNAVFRYIDDWYAEREAREAREAKKTARIDDQLCELDRLVNRLVKLTHEKPGVGERV
jgi:hypothetical protein